MQIETVRIAGLGSAEDMERLASVMAGGRGITGARGNGETLSLDIDFDTSIASIDDVVLLMKRAGFGVAGEERESHCCGGCCGSTEAGEEREERGSCG